MICHNCTALVTVGSVCPNCATPLALLQEPPASFCLKDDLYYKTLQLRAGQITQAEMGTELVLQQEKALKAIGYLREEDEELLIGLKCWQQAIGLAQAWLVSQSDFDLQAALHQATLADDCINQVIAAQVEFQRDLVRQSQAELRLRQNPMPEVPPEGLLIGFKLGEHPK